MYDLSNAVPLRYELKSNFWGPLPQFVLQFRTLFLRMVARISRASGSIGSHICVRQKSDQNSKFWRLWLNCDTCTSSHWSKMALFWSKSSYPATTFVQVDPIHISLCGVMFNELHVYVQKVWNGVYLGHLVSGCITIRVCCRIYGMELCSSTLQARLLSEKRLTDREVYYIIYQLLDFLVYLHELNVIHRDLKALNVGINDALDIRVSVLGAANYFLILEMCCLRIMVRSRLT